MVGCCLTSKRSEPDWNALAEERGLRCNMAIYDNRQYHANDREVAELISADTAERYYCTLAGSSPECK